MAANTDGVVVLFTAKAKPGKEREVRKLFVNLVTASRHDPGNIAYEVHEVEGAPATIVLYEQWISDELLQAHLATKPLKDLQAQIGDLIEGKFEDGLKKLTKLRPDPEKS